MIGFGQATGVHVRWMLHGGIHAYASTYPPVPIQVFMVALVVLDPLVVVLAALVRRSAIWLAAVIMPLDIAANWYGDWPRTPWIFLLDGFLILVTAPFLLRNLAGS
jgi:hypothetical protein